MQDEVLLDYRNQPYTKGLADLVDTFQPEVLLLGATTQGRDLAASVATTLMTGLTADCTGLDVDTSDRTLLSTRPTFGGSLMCTIVNVDDPAADGHRAAAGHVRCRSATRRAPGVSSSIRSGLAEADVVTKVIDFIPDARADKPQLAFADFIVAGGTRDGRAGELRAAVRPGQGARRRSRGHAPGGARELGRPRAVRSASRARRCGPSSTSRPAFPARSSTASAWKART